jgi:hypothetical protein
VRKTDEMSLAASRVHPKNQRPMYWSIRRAEIWKGPQGWRWVGGDGGFSAEAGLAPRRCRCINMTRKVRHEKTAFT